MIEAVGYLRWSGLSQGDGDSFDRQKEDIESFAAKNGYRVIRYYIDDGVTGKADENSRPAFQEMVSDLLGNGCRVIIVERLQRLARLLRIQEQLVIYLASKELTLFSADTGENITEAIKGDAMKWALVQMQGVFNELDRRLLVEKLAKARKRIKTQGRRPGQKGYSTDFILNTNAEGRKPMGQKPGESIIVDRMFALKASGLNYKQVADALNSEGHKTRYGKQWSTSGVHKILTRKPLTAKEAA